MTVNIDQESYLKDYPIKNICCGMVMITRFSLTFMRFVMFLAIGICFYHYTEFKAICYLRYPLTLQQKQHRIFNLFEINSYDTMTHTLLF